ncbi:hypothetical protein [Bradyrhizobium japonicum]|jgi:hypothetical protein|uniref:hypothetical protein n=1 Tax=Bradyrhizobium japonicum TaxID=375 RepID=UPI0020A12171|nr:hypothetical protein [Bradyrhizobium japonicum]MCP1764628.1 hypothetical protein [Bradyrhizobium japonicum]MCP1786764.1 hypothetical protein [Bradyrhizobium japonicum]MCP1808642.1 hypothetical protein [Bradyrhizobium japonicum]MCP1817569.1 hypothetical protein [Bradyrhizobium japonicum]MCP1870917.1 hypothetical protein [Bradyrhizobium japonicum]
MIAKLPLQNTITAAAMGALRSLAPERCIGLGLTVPDFRPARSSPHLAQRPPGLRERLQV